MLEQFDLDYILLEAHSEIAPPVGASIGMFPNGLRILDQIVCYEPIREVFGDQVPYNVTYTSNEKADVIAGIDGIFHHLWKRQPRIRAILFRSSKSPPVSLQLHPTQGKNSTGQEKHGRQTRQNGVNVTCADGSIVSGTILVGADGVQSSVRKAMHKLGHTLEPGYFDPKEEGNVPCWATGQQSMVTGKGRSQLVVSGPDDRVYWFLFERLSETKYGKDIPRYTKEDEERFVKRNRDVAITPTVRFGQVFEKKISSTLTPLHEVAYKKWFFKRILTLGDSVHKPNPIGGQGSNRAIESCAEFNNA
ncbi:hypothetical protein NW762_012777 [Fusarium torreyae]|uniref:FAD-binding domain-containing protein n=1 Tax=Fusarium torreyae TaxID=1237075 RepID=A0A9W8RQM0_9HYPO|nr:hypothetical protein NW762_012777 [Fusarium torreyae]